MTKYYEYQHRVRVEETDLTRTVHYVHYLRWQGRCREIFIQEHAPDVLGEIREDLKLFTLSVSCEFFSDATAFDEVSVRMRLEKLSDTQIVVAFDYVRVRDGREQLIARGHQRIACMRGPSTATRPTLVPASLRGALLPYVSSASAVVPDAAGFAAKPGDIAS